MKATEWQVYKMLQASPSLSVKEHGRGRKRNRGRKKEMAVLSSEMPARSEQMVN